MRDLAEAGGDWHRQLEAALGHLPHLDDEVAEAERQVPEYGEGWGR